MPFLSNWPLLKRLSLAPFRRSLTISAFSASLRFKEGILRTGKRRGAEERGGCAVGEGKKWMGREILAASLSLQPEIDVAGTFYLLSTGLVGQPLHARMAGRRSLQGSAFPGGSLGTIGFERQA